MQKIYSLQYLRAFAALWVLLTHVLQQCEVRPDGVLSFSIYLVHILIIRIIMNEAGVDNVYVVSVLSLLLTILASAAIYLLIEKRFINYAKRLVRRRNNSE